MDCRRPGLVFLTVLVVILPGCRTPPSPAPGAVTLQRGVVAAPEPQAAEVGAAILRAGGNAVDAAIAVQFALCVTNGLGAGLGGGGFMLIHDPAGSGLAETLDYREMAPAGASRDMFLDDRGEVVPKLSTYSPLASAVPGTVRGMAAAWERYGSLPWADLLAPAIRLAREGFVVDRWTAWSFEEYGGRFAQLPETVRPYIEFHEYYRGEEGSVLQIPDLAQTLERIAGQGADDFYTGRTAALITAEMERDGGLITAADLAGYEVVWREPVSTTYRGQQVVSMGPPSSGGVALLQILNMLEIMDQQPLHSVPQVHLFAEVAKRVFADRAEHLGDPDFHDGPVAALIDKGYAHERVVGIELHRRSDPATVRAGSPGAALREGTETTHFTVVDQHGMAVANTTTLNTAYGSGVVVDGAGFLLNSQMDDFSAKPGVRNYYGVTGSSANRIEAGKRPLSSMTPTMVFDAKGRLSLALGSPGGPSIITAVAQVILHVIDYHLELQDAVDQPRFHHQWPPGAGGEDFLKVETLAGRELPATILTELEKLGYTLKYENSLGDVQAVIIHGDEAVGVFDRRRTGGVAYQ